MFYSNKLKQEFPDQNVFYNPFYMQRSNFFYAHNSVIGSQNIEEESKAQGPYRIGNNIYHQKYSAFPRQVKLVVIQREGDDVNNLMVSSVNSFQIKGTGKNKISEAPTSETISDSENSIVKPKFTVTKNYFSNEIMTEFNNHPKLKKINSSYHLKRKISTKLQNDLKENVNSLISEVNEQLNIKLPMMTHNSKEFRENVKNDFLKLYGNQTVGKYICEEVLVERKQPTSVGLENNKKLIAKIEELYQSSQDNQHLKKLIYLFHKTLVKEFFSQFLDSSRYKKCLEKDIKKYAQKLENIEKFTKEKMKIFIEIYSLKYDGIARSYFN